MASQALTLAYAPVVAYNAWKRRDSSTLLAAAAFLAGALVQLVVIAGATGRHLTERSPLR